MVSDEDLADVVEQLDLTEMEKLYIRLGLPKSVIKKAIHAEENYGDPDLRGQSVLRRWREIQGKNASRKVLLDALGMCENYEALEILEAKWTEEEAGNTGDEMCIYKCYYDCVVYFIIHTLRVQSAHAAANLNWRYWKYTKVARVHYFCTITLRTRGRGFASRVICILLVIFCNFFKT